MGIVSIPKERVANGYIRGQLWRREDEREVRKTYDLIRARQTLVTRERNHYYAVRSPFYLSTTFATITTPDLPWWVRGATEDIDYEWRWSNFVENSNLDSAGFVTTGPPSSQIQTNGVAIERRRSNDPAAAMLRALIAEFPLSNAGQYIAQVVRFTPYTSGQPAVESIADFQPIFQNSTYPFPLPLSLYVDPATNLFREPGRPTWLELALPGVITFSGLASTTGSFRYRYWGEDPNPSPANPLISRVFGYRSGRVALESGQPFSFSLQGLVAHTLTMPGLLASQGYTGTAPTKYLATNRDYATELGSGSGSPPPGMESFTLSRWFKLMSSPGNFAYNVRGYNSPGPGSYVRESTRTTGQELDYGLVRARQAKWDNLTALDPIGPWP